MTPFALYCKSYRTDLKRVLRLARSVQRFNVEKLPFYISVPQEDRALFSEQLAGLDLHLLTDESIVEASPAIGLQQVQSLAGSVSQQVIKAEFWRLGLAESYLCLDSDAFFIRPFTQSEFLAADGTPYTMMDEGHDLLEAALAQGRPRIVTAFSEEAALLQARFERVGRRYSFGPFPLVWHRAVWQSLETHYLAPRSMNLADAITQAPIESRWYGEALLAYKAIALLPCQAMFKVYHYAWQLDRERLSQEELAQLYCGVIYQSSWERELDWPAEGGGYASRAGRRLRRLLGRI